MINYKTRKLQVLSGTQAVLTPAHAHHNRKNTVIQVLFSVTTNDNIWHPEGLKSITHSKFQT
jgi:hypothetical protein